MNQSQADLIDEDRRLQTEREALIERLNAATAGERDGIAAQIAAVEKQRAELLPRILHGGIEFGGE
jgi:hypothetical protein